MKPTNVLFVCLGNICRSPTAHGVFESLLRGAGLDQFITVDSAGTGDWHIGEPPDRRAVRSAFERGYDLSHLRSRQVKAGDFQTFDFILAMDLKNLSNLQRLAPRQFSGKLNLFLDYTDLPKPAEVPDPYGGGQDDFEQVLSLIEHAAEKLLHHLVTNWAQPLVGQPG
jgi:protein-tyrosine phosphatase